MKAESIQLFLIPITQNHQGVTFAPHRDDASHLDLESRSRLIILEYLGP